MSKRANGDGSVYRIKSGGWVATMTVLDPVTGETKRRYRRARTKAAAMDRLRTMQQEIQTVGHLPDASRTVTDAIADFLMVRAGQSLELGARKNDLWATSHIDKALGTRKVAALTVEECDQFLRSAAAGRFGAPLGRDQLKRLRSRLIKILENDRRRGLVVRNVGDLSVVPEVSAALVPRRPRRALSPDELARLIEESSGVATVLIDLSSRHGLRPAEARALRWSRVDFDRQTIRVDAQVNRANELVKVKTKRSARTIRIDPITVGRLNDWHTQQEAAEQKADFAWSGNPLGLVATTAFGTPLNQRNVHRTLATVSRKAGIDPEVSGYELRHTAITLQIEKETPVHLVADWAGTSERMIWDVYRHLLNEVSDVGPSDSF